jgi:hypothetical protein
MVTMRMMEVPFDEIVDVATMRNRVVATAGSVNVALLVPSAAVIRRAYVRIPGADRDGMFGHHTTFLVAQMPVLKIVHMPVVIHPKMPAIRAVLVTRGCR